ncbi:hypothetical protein FEM48_Zijuj06G0193900 [Ziziphus jujuba var. spinosa]|uniref:Uncharacterized protein n=1 Tax=Ziziphus jujuba var. spinosa TaxID=714518 RepID=A0A978VB59_ZIZJJ|nr:hypothetical protein FEM48_Zijuj06G0193900 [Ziziphus jujuba var. spinosa]
MEVNLAPRGLRHDDPLSSYLFIQGSEALSRMLAVEEYRRNFHGIKVASVAPAVSHLLFVDDIILFGRPNVQESARLLDCINKYAKRLNKEVVHRGNPLFISRSKVQAFKRFKEKLKHRVEHLQGRLLSQVGNMALVREDLSTIPVYFMSKFQLPLKLYKEMDSILRSFWWKGFNSSSKSYNLIAWDKICQRKYYGGLGIRRIIDFSFALLAKLGWIMAINEDRIWVKILKATYCRLDSFLHCKISKNCSYTWKRIIATRKAIKQKACFMVRNGHSVDVWKDA